MVSFWKKAAKREPLKRRASCARLLIRERGRVSARCQRFVGAHVVFPKRSRRCPNIVFARLVPGPVKCCQVRLDTRHLDLRAHARATFYLSQTG